MSVLRVVQFTQLRQLLECQRALAFEHPKARRIAGLPVDERTFDQPVELRHDSTVVDIWFARHRHREFEREAADECPQLPKQSLLRCAQQSVAPLQGGQQRPLPAG